MGLLKTTFDVTAELEGEVHDWRVTKRDKIVEDSFDVIIESGGETVLETTVATTDDPYQPRIVPITLDGHDLTFTFGSESMLKDALVITQGDTEIYRSFDGEFSDGGALGKVLRTLDTEEDYEEKKDDPLEDDSRKIREYVVSVVLALIVFGFLFYLGKDTDVVVKYLAKKAILPVILAGALVVGFVAIVIYELFSKIAKRSDMS